MEYLYVCHFSNGHIKVGRSVEPMARIAAHADRVACVGVELIEHFIAECPGHSIPNEAALIDECAIHAASRNKNEWFVGLDYESVCQWATAIASVKNFKKEVHFSGTGGALDQLVLALLDARRGDWQSISAASGVSYSWLSKFANGHIPNPGFATLSKLHETLTKPASVPEAKAPQAPATA